MSKPVTTFVNDMFTLSAFPAGMEINKIEDLPHYCVEVIDPEIMAPAPMYIRVALSDGYAGPMDPDTFGRVRRETVKDLMVWHVKLGMQASEAQRAAERFPLWHLMPNMAVPMGTLSGVQQAIGVKMSLSSCFMLKAYRKVEHRVMECQSNVFGKWTENGVDYPWAMESINERLGGNGVSVVQYGSLTVDREAFSESLNGAVLDRWPYLEHVDMANARPVFEVLTLEEFNKLFPRARMILDMSRLPK
jgi:hypothetical protein